MPRHRRCANFAWRDDDPAYLTERINDRTVFRKIRREIARASSSPLSARAGLSPLAVLTRLSRNPLWASRLAGKSLPSWKRAYYKWRKSVPANTRTRRNTPPDLYKSGGGRRRAGFFPEIRTRQKEGRCSSGK